MALDFFAGCMGGAAGVLVGHPLDTVKVRLQTQSPNNIKYRGTFHCLQTIVKQESIRGLYKGISSPVIGVAGVNALIFGVYGSLRPYVSGSPGHDALWAHFAAGSISGAVQSFVASPMELVKTRMQLNESTTSKAPTSWDVLKGIYKSEGGLFRGVFKGWGVTVAREIPGFGIYFATYEALTSKSGYQVGTFGMMMAGGMAGVASWILTFPIDVVKTRIQSDVSGSYKGVVDCIKKTWVNEGSRAFSRGLVSSVIRAFPTNAATFTVVTWIMRWAEENQTSGEDNGRRFLEQVMAETTKAQERLEESIRTKFPQYMFHEGSRVLSLSHNLRCSIIPQDYLSLLEVTPIGSDSSGKGGSVLREKMMEAFHNDRAIRLLEGNTRGEVADNKEDWIATMKTDEAGETKILSHETSFTLPLVEKKQELDNAATAESLSNVSGHIVKAGAPQSATPTAGRCKQHDNHWSDNTHRPSQSTLTFWNSLVEFFIQTNIARIGLCKCLEGDRCVCLS